MANQVGRINHNATDIGLSVCNQVATRGIARA